MNAISQIVRLRSTDSIHADMDAQQRVLKYLRHLAVNFIDIDTRPMVFDGKTVTKVGPDPIPQELRDMLAAEQTKLTLLEAEYHDAEQRDHQRAYHSDYRW